MGNMLIGAKGGKGGGGAARAAQEDPNTLRSVATARIIDLVSEGEIVGLANGLQSVYFDGVPVQNADGSFNFQGVKVEQRVGTPSQASVSGFAAVEAERLVDQRVEYGSPVERVVTDPDIDAVRPKLVIPALTQQDKETGDLHGYKTTIAIDVQASGGAWVEVVRDVIEGKTTADYEKQYRIDKPAGGVPWAFRMRRVVVDHDDDSSINDQTFFGTYTEVVDAKMAYPHSAYLAITIDADQFGDKIPKRSYDLFGIIVKVPSNYNPVTRGYSGLWDGTFKLAHTDNPAWVLYDLITNNRYGLGEFVDEARVNKGQLYQIAQYCDELIDDGFGGTQPRWTFNAQIRTQDDAYTLLRKVASVYRGVNYYGSGTINFVHDAPSDPVMIVAPANVVDGVFTYSSRSLKSRYSAVLTTYSNPSDAGRPAIDIWEDQAAVAARGWRKKDITAYACDSAGQARRTGKYEIDDDQNSLKSVNYKCGLDHLNVRPGDVIAVQDPSVAGMRLGGRIARVSVNRVFVDALPSDLPLNFNYTLRVMNRAGDVLVRQVQSVDIKNNLIKTVSPLTDVAVGAVWVMSAAEVELPLFRVRNISRDGAVYSVDADEYDPNKYARIEQGLVLDDPDFTLLPEGVIKPPKNFVISETLYRDGTTIKTAVNVSVTPAGDPRAAYVQFQYKLSADSGWLSYGIDADPFMDLRGLRDGQVIYVRARTIGKVGRQSVWLEGGAYVVQGKLAPPATPTGLVVQIRPETGVQINKDASAEVDYKETRFYVGPNFASATLLHVGAVSSYLWDKAAAGTQTVWVVDYDTGSRASVPASVVFSVVAPAVPVVSSAFSAGSLILSWPAVAGDFAISHYVIGYDETELEQAKTTTFKTQVNWQGQRNFWVRAVDIAGNESAAGDVEVQIPAPAQPVLSAVYEGASLRLSWDSALTALPIAEYIISEGGNEFTRVTARSVLLPVTWGSSKTFSVSAVDVAGNEGLPMALAVPVVLPFAPVVGVQVEGRNMRVNWQAQAGSLPIEAYEVADGGGVVERINALTVLLPLQFVGDRTLRVTAIDTAGNRSEQGSAVINVGVPAAPVVTAVIEAGVVQLSWSPVVATLPVDLYEVWADGALLEKINALTYAVNIAFAGVKEFEVVAVDSAGNRGAEGKVGVTVNPPLQPVVQAGYEGADLRLHWGDSQATLPIKCYELTENGVVLEQLNARSFLLPVTWSASRTFGVVAVDIAGNRSVEGSVTVGVVQPQINSVDLLFEEGRATFTVVTAGGSLPLGQLQIFSGSVLIAAVYSDTWSIPVNWVGSKNFQFYAVDSAGNKSAGVVKTVSPQLPSLPEITGEFVNRNVQLSWSNSATSLPISFYIVQNGAQQIKVTQPNYSVAVDWVGNRDISVIAFDSAGNESGAGVFTVSPVLPSGGLITSEVIDNNVLFKYSAKAGSLPIDHYELKKGAELETAVAFAIKAGNSSFTTLFESTAGAYTYWLIPVDTAGNKGLAVSTTATVSQPPDYVLFAKYSARELGWPGVFDNAVVTERGTLLTPVDDTETWGDYVANGYATMQAEIDAGFPYWAQPSPAAGSHESIIDYGTVLTGSLITLSTTPDLIAGDVTTEMRLSYSEDGVTWVDGDINQLQVYGKNFRYVRVRGDYIGDGNDLVEIEDIQIRLDRKLRSDAGSTSASAGDVGGTRVYFNTDFIDVTAINVTPKGTAALVPVVDFQDVPNPQYFDVYLYSDLSGTRASADFSWNVSGY